MPLVWGQWQGAVAPIHTGKMCHAWPQVKVDRYYVLITGECHSTMRTYIPTYGIYVARVEGRRHVSLQTPRVSGMLKSTVEHKFWRIAVRLSYGSDGLGLSQREWHVGPLMGTMRGTQT